MLPQHWTNWDLSCLRAEAPNFSPSSKLKDVAASLHTHQDHLVGIIQRARPRESERLFVETAGKLGRGMIPIKPEDSTFHSKEHSDKRRSKIQGRIPLSLCQACRKYRCGKKQSVQAREQVGRIAALQRPRTILIPRPCFFSPQLSRSDLSLGR